jgi:hypothetical protein
VKHVNDVRLLLHLVLQQPTRSSRRYLQPTRSSRWYLLPGFLRPRLLELIFLYLLRLSTGK